MWARLGKRLGVVLILLWPPLTTPAATVTAPLIQFDVTVAGQQRLWTDSSSPNPEGSYDVTGELTMMNLWSFSWDMAVDPDPFISSNLVFTNLTGNTANFSAIISLPLSASLGSVYMGGAIDGGFRDNNDGSVTVAEIASNGIFSGLIDGATALQLLGGSFGCSASSPGCNGVIGQVSDGLPGPTLLYHTGANNTIGIKLDFSLTAGDTATFNTFFEVIPVPLPAALWLLGSGLLLLSGLLHRHNNN